MYESVQSPPTVDRSDPLVVSCDTCTMRRSPACEDCLVTFLCGGATETAVIFDFHEQRAVKLLAKAGMVPTLRHRAVS